MKISEGWVSDAQMTNGLHAMLSHTQQAQLTEEKPDRLLRQSLSDFSIPYEVFP